MLTTLNLQTLMFMMALVGIILLVCLMIYGKVQKTYDGYGYWLGSYACSVAMLILFGLRGAIPDVLSIIAANIFGATASHLLFVGFSRLHGSLESGRKNAWPMLTASAAIIYFTLVRDDVLLRTLVMTGCISVYTLFIMKVCWFYREQQPRVACRMFSLLFFSFSLVSLIRAGVWLISPEQRNLFAPSMVNNIYLLSYFIMQIGLAFLIVLINGLRITTELRAEKENTMQAHQQLRQLNYELEAKVTERTAELEDLYNNAPCGYHSFDAEGVYVRINDTELKWLGLSREAVVGKRKFIEFVAPEYVPRLHQAIQTLKTRGFTAGVSFELRGVNGERRQVVGGATAVVDENGAYLRSRSTLFDISEQHKLDLQNRQRDKMLQEFLDEASDPVHITDHAGKFVYVNQAWLSLFGYHREEAMQLSLYDVTNPSEHARWDWLLHTAQDADSHQRSEYVFVDKAGNPLFIETVILARFDKEDFAGTQAILIDVTTRRKMEDALREEQRKLSIANQELERMSSMKDDFLASMSHELRTPLTAVIGLSEIMRDGAYGELSVEQLDAIASIEQSGRHLLALINDILDLSKLEAKQVALELEDCSAADIGQASLQFIKSMAAKKGILVDYTVQPDSISLRADPRRLKQMLINLLSNAVKFTPDGGKVGLLIRAERELQRIMFTVWDNGIGIRGEDMGKLFQPFVQIDSSLGRQYSGTGLGLVLVQKAARMHGGQVVVESTYGAGSRFTIELPWQPSDEELPGEKGTNESEHSSQDKAADNAAALVLLAEDNPDNVRVVVAALRNKPWRIIVAEDGLKAVELAAIHNPDIILMDIQMPYMDGLAATRLIRADADQKLAGTPIIALTALAMKGDKERCLRAGADEYIAKPIDFKELIGKIEALLRAARAK